MVVPVFCSFLIGKNLEEPLDGPLNSLLDRHYYGFAFMETMHSSRPLTQTGNDVPENFDQQLHALTNTEARCLNSTLVHPTTTLANPVCSHPPLPGRPEGTETAEVDTQRLSLLPALTRCLRLRAGEFPKTSDATVAGPRHSDSE